MRNCIGDDFPTGIGFDSERDEQHVLSGRSVEFSSMAVAPERRLSSDHPRVEQVSTRVVFVGCPATCANCGDEIETGSRHKRLLFRTSADTAPSFEEFATCDTACLESFVTAW